MWDEIYDRVAALAQEHRTTLVFVNTRRLAERVAHHLGERLGENAVLPHHGSLSRRLRHEAEQRLKKGELRAVVATASLELGIDIGTVDLVCQIGSPRSIAVALQRIGRAGHWVGALPKGRFFATTRDELIECARAGARHSRRGDWTGWRFRALRWIFWRSRWSRHARLRGLGRRRSVRADAARRILIAISRGTTSMPVIGDAFRRHRHVARPRGAYLHRDQVNHRVRGRRGARLAAITTGGAIPETAQYQVVAEPDGTVVGSLDEDFAVESMAGDIFLLGTTSWRIRRVETGRVRVEDAHGAAPTIPFWRGEAPGRTRELRAKFRTLRAEIVAAADPVAMLERECGLDRRGAEQAVEYVRAGQRALGVVPSAGHRGRRAILRRRRRHATGDSRAVRVAHQPGVGAGAAQALLPDLQFRTAGRGHRQRAGAVAERSAFLPAWNWYSVS